MAGYIPDTGDSRDTADAYIGADGCAHRRFRLDKDDASPTVRRYAPESDHRHRRYHPRCSGCYLGHAHSVAYHDAHAQGSW